MEQIPDETETIAAKRSQRLAEKLKKAGETVCIIEHDMEFVQKIADHVVVMDAGRVLMEGSPHEVLKDKRVLEAYLGE